MKIQLGTIYLNKTKKYLAPVIKEYGEELTERLNGLFKLGMGVGDFALMDMGMKLETHLFILIDTNLSKRSFNSTMNWLKLQNYFAFDYAFDDLHLGHLHMIALEVPPKYHDALSRFKNSEFSAMFDYDDLIKFFADRQEEIAVFTKDKNFRVEFVQRVNTLYNTMVDPIEWKGELEFPINIEEEYFSKN